LENKIWCEGLHSSTSFHESQPYEMIVKSHMPPLDTSDYNLCHQKNGVIMDILKFSFGHASLYNLKRCQGSRAINSMGLFEYRLLLKIEN